MSSRPTSSLPLRWHLVRLTAGTLLPVVAFASVVAFQLARTERLSAERRVVHSARVLAASFEREISGSIRTLQALAASDALEREDLGTFLAECERVRRTQPSWKTVLLIRPDGQTLLNTAVPPGTASPPWPSPRASRALSRILSPRWAGSPGGVGRPRSWPFPCGCP